jgi:2-C-methyl-D-erythritol 4-phosphate cytidylyltransferase
MDHALVSFHRIGVLLLGGLGTRFGASKPKQFLPMAGKALCLYGAEAFERSSALDFLVYVIPEGYEANFAILLKEAGHLKPSAIIVGGASRQESSQVALSYLHEHGLASDALVLIQDGDRPNLQERYLLENMANAEKYGSSVTAIPSSDSVAISKYQGILDGYIPRNEVYLLQTPQAFRFGPLYEASQAAGKDVKKYTDDASLLLAYKGIQPHIVLGDKTNLKITTPEDEKDFERSKL